jgi:hypothetical protein
MKKLVLLLVVLVSIQAHAGKTQRTPLEYNISGSLTETLTAGLVRMELRLVKAILHSDNSVEIIATQRVGKGLVSSAFMIKEVSLGAGFAGPMGFSQLKRESNGDLTANSPTVTGGSMSVIIGRVNEGVITFNEGIGLNVYTILDSKLPSEMTLIIYGPGK